MRDVEFGRSIRALRRRKALRQIDVARAAGLSDATVSRIEHGDLDRFTVAAVRRVCGALDSTFDLRLVWGDRGGAALQRLLDRQHAALAELVATLLTRLGWEVAPEATFSIYGERGSIDLIAFHPRYAMLLVVEIETELADLQGLLASIDRKVRLAPRVARDRGWAARRVSVALVIPDGRTNRRRVAAHRVLLRRSSPADRTFRKWVRDPGVALRGVIFLPLLPAAGVPGGWRG